jgi:hypothetical protein
MRPTDVSAVALAEIVWMVCEGALIFDLRAGPDLNIRPAAMRQKLADNS